MTPPRDPDSGKGRVPHVDHAFREVPTRPGPHVDLDATADDFPPSPTPIREFHRLEQRVANVEGVALETKIRLEQADSLSSTEWAQRVDKQIAAVAVDAKAGADLAAVVASIRRRTWAAIGSSLGACAAALWFALGVARASGVKAGVDQEREIRRAADAARLDAVEQGAAKLREEIARILGILDGARPYRAAPYLGPPSPSQQEP
jgi:hypothetical protein